MCINEYRKQVKRTVNKELGRNDQLYNFLFGLTGEVGELVNYFKKIAYQGHEYMEDYAKEEIGDIFWYLINLCNILEFDVHDVLDGNIDKLKKRYPNGFSVNDSIYRTK